MTLIKSISGIRGTIGGKPKDNLTPIDIVECIAGFGTWMKRRKSNRKVVVGRDGRISGSIVSQLSIQTLLSMGLDVIDLDYSTTPTVEMMVNKLDAGAGIIFTASHNPKEYNALKFLNHKGEFISAQDGQEIIDIIAKNDFVFSETDYLGNYSIEKNSIEQHIDSILKYKHVNVEAIQRANFKVVVDCINSTGAIAIPPLLEKLGVQYELINFDTFGHFAHNPEPLPHHLLQLQAKVISSNANLGIALDPDVDRLAFVCEDGSFFGEEYTLVAVADYILSREKGNTVSNLSSTRALADVTHLHGGKYFASAVGEVNVVNEMKKTQAIIGGEGNGGIIIPDLHYGRDAMAGIAVFLSGLAEFGGTASEYRQKFPNYIIIKDKITLANDADLDTIFEHLKSVFAKEKINTIDGLKIDFEEGWVHMRKSNTEPIVRIYAEAATQESADKLISLVKNEIV